MHKLFRIPPQSSPFAPSQTSASAAPSLLRKITLPLQTQNLPLYALKPRWNLPSAFAQPDATLAQIAQKRKNHSLNRTKKVMRITESSKADLVRYCAKLAGNRSYPVETSLIRGTKEVDQ